MKHFKIEFLNYSIEEALNSSISKEDGLIKTIYPENIKSRSQDLTRVYHIAGQWYWLNTSAIHDEFSIFDGNNSTIVLDPTPVQDIDNVSDWKSAEIKFKLLIQSEI